MTALYIIGAIGVLVFVAGALLTRAANDPPTAIGGIMIAGVGLAIAGICCVVGLGIWMF